MGAIHAMLLVLAFPPFSYWGFAFLAPIPLFAVALHPMIKPSRAALWGGIGASPAWLAFHWWVRDVSAMGLMPMVVVLSMYTMLFLWIATRVVERFGRPALLLPLVWVGVEFFRGSVFAHGYPWYLLAHPLIDSPRSVLAMPASIGGVYLVSFLCSAYSFLLYMSVRDPQQQRRKRAGFAAAGLFGSWLIAGLLLTPAKELHTAAFRFAVVQPDVPQDNRIDWSVRQRYRDWQTLRDITLAAASDPTNPLPLDLIIWPEGFVPGWTLDPVSLETERAAQLAWSMTPRDSKDVPELEVPARIRATEVVDQLLYMQQRLGIPMLVGSVGFENLHIVDTPEGIEYKRDAMYNSAFLIRSGKVGEVWYDKLHLTPFGEVMPYISGSEWLEQSLLALGANGMEFALSPGREPRNITVPVSQRGGQETSIATPICFEATVSSVCRRLVARGGIRRAGVMVNITNDGWFGNARGARKSHLQNARWRCIELQTPMIRSANTGISGVIDHRGQVLDTTIIPLRENPREGYMISQVFPAKGLTPFAHMGDLFGWLCMLLTMMWVFTAIFRPSRGVNPMNEHDEA